MDNLFDEYVANTKAKYKSLLSEQIIDFSTSKRIVPQYGGIYQFYEFINDNWEIVYVGRTRNFHQRFGLHVRFDPNQASFAFKRTRSKLGLPATYKKGSGAKQLMLRDDVQKTFRQEIENIKDMRAQFIKVDDPVEQYLLELYAAMKAGLDLKDFDTH